MSDYISREAAVELLSQPITMSMCLSVEECHHKIAQQRIDRYLVENIPAADVRPVVRCADCKWFQNNMRQDGYLPEGVPEWECRYWCGPCDPTDFCSYGARMEEQK